MKTQLFPESAGSIRKTLIVVAFILVTVQVAAFVADSLRWIPHPWVLMSRLPLPVLIAIAAAGSVVSAEIIVELLRYSIPGATGWSERKHLRLVTILWVLIAAIQITLLVVWRDRLGCEP
jgi:hypothetical protein